MTVVRVRITPAKAGFCTTDVHAQSNYIQPTISGFLDSFFLTDTEIGEIIVCEVAVVNEGLDETDVPFCRCCISGPLMKLGSPPPID